MLGQIAQNCSKRSKGKVRMDEEEGITLHDMGTTKSYYVAKNGGVITILDEESIVFSEGTMPRPEKKKKRVELEEGKVMEVEVGKDKEVLEGFVGKTNREGDAGSRGA